MAVGGGEDCVAHGVLLGMCRWRTTRRWRAAAGSRPGPASTSCAALACSPIPAPTTRWVPAFQHTHTHRFFGASEHSPPCWHAAGSLQQQIEGVGVSCPCLWTERICRFAWEVRFGVASGVQLLAACERDGEADRALEAFARMEREAASERFLLPFSLASCYLSTRTFPSKVRHAALPREAPLGSKCWKVAREKDIKECDRMLGTKTCVLQAYCRVP